MLSNNRLFYLFLTILFFTSCSKSVTEGETKEDLIEITSFTITSGLNHSLNSDIILEEDNGFLKGQIPSYISKKLIPIFNTNAVKVLIGHVEQVSGETEVDFSNTVTYTLIGSNGGKREVTVQLQGKDFSIPHITITIENDVDVTSKEDYLKADINVEGNELYPNYSGTTEIRGRGNSTWNYPKKPYRLKLTTKSEVLGLPSARNWVLLANYLDPSLMCNTVAMKIGRDLGLPYTNQTIPVDLTINGQYRGSYLLTQQVEVNENRVDIGDNGFLFELDTYFDEKYKFKSSNYNLPVMIKSPELESLSEVSPIQDDFQNLEDKIFSSNFPKNNYTEFLDVNAFAKFILVYFLTGNEEVNHPKSIYVTKKVGGKYTFGPIWDFDWAYGFESGDKHFTNASRPLFWSGNAVGTRFFKRLFEDPQVQNAFRSEWSNFKQHKFDNLLKYIDEYALLIKESKSKDELIWKKGENFDADVSRLKQYLRGRSAYIDSYIAGF